jgi:hypothetical protein
MRAAYARIPFFLVHSLPASSVCHSTRQATATPNLGICFGARQFVLCDGLSRIRSPRQ